MRARGFLAGVPLAIGALALLLPAVLLWASLATEAVAGGEGIILFTHLDGVTAPIQPVLSVAGLLDGSYQAQEAKLIGTLTPVYRLAVRVKSEIFYRLFQASGVPAVEVGRGRELVERSYIEEYCSRDLHAFQVAADAWLPHLQEMQEGLERRGQQFLYVITPSKIAQYPSFMPSGMKCPAPASARLGLLPAWRAMLDRAGIHYVDTTVAVAAAHGRFPFALFPRGGTHWNMVGAAVAGQAVTAALDAPRTDGVFAPFTFTWTLSDDPIYPDNDLALLMNLIRPDVQYDVPHVAFQDEPPRTPCHPVNVAILSGSFMHQLGAVLSQGTCRPHLEMWEYWTAYHITWPQPPGPLIYRPGPVDPAARDRAILAADVVIYEENEQLLAHTRHGPLLYAFLKGQPGWMR